MARPPAPAPYSSHHVYLYRPQIDALRSAAHRQGTNISSVVRDLIDRHLLGQKPGRAAQAQAGAKPDFPAEQQCGETSPDTIL